MNKQPCPNCEAIIDTTQAFVDGACPECNVPTAPDHARELLATPADRTTPPETLLEIANPNREPEDHYQHEP